jgi:hypothetical protein
MLEFCLSWPNLFNIFHNSWKFHRPSGPFMHDKRWNKSSISHCYLEGVESPFKWGSSSCCMNMRREILHLRSSPSIACLMPRHGTSCGNEPMSILLPSTASSCSVQLPTLHSLSCRCMSVSLQRGWSSPSFAPIKVSPSSLAACTASRENGPPKPRLLWSCTEERR